MAEELRYEFLAEFDGSLGTVGEKRGHESVRFYRIGEGRYCKAFHWLTDMNKLPGEPVPLSDREHSQWHLDVPIEMDEKQAKNWIREKVSRIFSEPEALWGGN